MHSAFSAATDKRRKSIRFEAQGGFKEQYGLAAEGAGELVALDRLDFHGRFVVFETLIVVDAELKRVSGDWNVLDEESDPR